MPFATSYYPWQTTTTTAIVPTWSMQPTTTSTYYQVVNYASSAITNTGWLTLRQQRYLSDYYRNRAIREASQVSQRELCVAEYQRGLEETRQRINNIYADVAVPRLPNPVILKKRQDGREAVRRSIALFRRVRSDEEIKTFLSGKPLVIRGQRFDYRVRKRERILDHTINPYSAHIPYDLHLLNKATGRKLASGCVIVPGTPVIDQLLAFILHTQDRESELEMLKTTNWNPGLRHIMRFMQGEPSNDLVVGPPIYPRMVDAA